MPFPGWLFSTKIGCVSTASIKAPTVLGGWDGNKSSMREDPDMTSTVSYFVDLVPSSRLLPFQPPDVTTGHLSCVPDRQLKEPETHTSLIVV